MICGSQYFIRYEYLKKRDLSDEIIKKFGLGYTGRNSGLYGLLKSKGFGDSEISQSGLITFDEQKGPRDKFWNRVTQELHLQIIKTY